MSASARGLSDSAVRGVLWTGGGQLLRQIVQIGSQLVLARLLAPDDFGMLGMALVFIGIGQLLADFGIGSAIVQARELGPKVLSTCFWLNLAVGAALMLLVLACAPLIARFYARPDLLPLVAVLSLNLLLSAMQTVPMGLLYRDMRFADLARAQVLGTLGAAAVAIGMAWAGFGAWALIAQPLAGTSLMLLVAWRATGWLPRLECSYIQARPLMRFSMALLGTNLVGYANRNVDGLLIGRFLGAGPLGVYSLAIQIMLFPLQQISGVIVRVLFPTLAQIQDDLPRLRSAYLKAVSTIALITFPLMTGLFSLASDFVQVFFGHTWAEMAPILRVLCWVGLLQSIGTTVGTIYLSLGRAEIAMRVTVIGAPVLVLGIASGLPWGIFGVAVGYACASAVLFVYTLVEAFRLIDLRLVAFFLQIIRPLSASLAMSAILLLVQPIWGQWSAVARLAGGVILGMISYSTFSFLFNRAQLRDLWQIASALQKSGKH